MPDFDKIHDGPGPYQKPCRQLMDGMPVEVIADALLRPILSTIKHFGDDSLLALQHLADQLDQLPAGPLFRGSIDWGDESKEIDRVIRQSLGENKRGLSTVQRVAKRQLQELQSGVYPLRDMKRMLLSNYIVEIVKDCFEDPVKRMLYRSEGFHLREQIETLEQLRLHTRPGIDNIVDQVMTGRSAASLRKPPRMHTTNARPTTPANVAELPSVYTEDLDSITF